MYDRDPFDELNSGAGRAVDDLDSRLPGGKNVVYIGLAVIAVIVLIVLFA